MARLVAMYGEVAAALAEQGATIRAVASEVAFLRNGARDLPPLLAARQHVLATLGHAAWAPPLAAIEQAPVDPAHDVELLVWAIVPHRGQAWSAETIPASPSCACRACALAGARLVRQGDQRVLHAVNIHGTGHDAYEQARNMFRAAERLLEASGMAFQHVVRTWISLRDIDRDYAALNRARREFFQERGIVPLPASTGVQGVPLAEEHVCAMRLLALQSSRPLQRSVMSAACLNEPSSYGADFSRGLRVQEANRITLHVSGTASIDASGRSVHAGAFAAQTHRMLDNIAALLNQQGASFGDVLAGTSYVRDARDAGVLQTIYRQRGFDVFPDPIVVAPLCRPELLCEAEVVAALPAAPGSV